MISKKTIQERFKAIGESKTEEELAMNVELFQLQAQLEHERFMRKIAETSLSINRLKEKILNAVYDDE